MFDRVLVVGRFLQGPFAPEAEGFVVSSNDSVDYIALPDFRGPRGMAANLCEVRETVREACPRADAILFRVPSPVAMISYGVIRAAGVPFGIEVVVNPATAFQNGRPNDVAGRLMGTVAAAQVKLMAREASGVSYVTAHTLQSLYPCAALLKGSGGKHFTASYTTASLGPESFRDPSSFTPVLDPVRIACVGSMGDARKRQDVVLRTVGLLRRQGIDASAVLVGDGCQKGALVSLAESLGIGQNCSFTGQLSGPEEVRRVLDESTVLMCPSISEGLPRCVLEAMARGLPCLGSGVDGMSELLGPACVVDTNEPADYAEAIVALTKDRGFYARTAAEQYARSRSYDNSVVQASREDFYMKLRDS